MFIHDKTSSYLRRRGFLIFLLYNHSVKGGDPVASVDDKKITDIISELKKLKFGSLIITVHDDEVTQIETTEKKRYQAQGKKQRTK